MMLFAVANIVAGVVEVIYLMVATPRYGLNCSAWGNTVFYVIVDIVAFMELHHRIGGVGIRHMAVSAVRSLALGAAGAVAAFLILQLLGHFFGPTDGSMLKGILYSVIGGIPALIVTYGGAVALKIPEADAIGRLMDRFLPARLRR